MKTDEIIEELIYIKDSVLLQSEVEVINEACNLLDKLPNMMTEIPELDEVIENKCVICDFLAVTLKATRALSDLLSLKFDPETEIVTAYFIHGGARRINVACDSGVAMIRDIMKCLGV